MSMIYFTVKSKQKELIVRTYRNHTESNCRKRSWISWELESGQVACLRLLCSWTPQLLVSASLCLNESVIFLSLTVVFSA